MFTRFSTASTTAPEEMVRFSIFSPPPREAVVRDDVTTTPVANPYAALQRASDRLAAGQSVFGVSQSQEVVAA